MEKYRNLANSDHPATLIYLVDISGSMKALMPDGKSRIDVAKASIQTSYAQMIQRSLRQGKIHPRYRVGMIAYSADIYDVYGEMGSIITIDKLKDEGIPLITPQQGTRMARAFRYATKLIQQDIREWPLKWLNNCPPPMVVNITDCEYSEEDPDVIRDAMNLRSINVPDGNVLIENIFITDQITLPNSDIKTWHGYYHNETTGDPYGDKLLAISSPMPSSYTQIMSEQLGIRLKMGAAMMFPGVNQEFIKTGFAMSIVSGSQVRHSSFRLKPQSPKKAQRFSRPLRVFLCHSSDDKSVVNTLYKQLINEEWIDPWLDEKKIKAGQDWDLEIRNAVSVTDVVIVCLSENSVNKEGFVQKEIVMALDKADEKPEGTIFIIPLKLDDCDVPLRLRRWHWIDTYASDWYEKLIDALAIRASKIIESQ